MTAVGHGARINNRNRCWKSNVRKADDDCLRELLWTYDRRDLQEALPDLTAWIIKWQGKYPKLVDWVEDNLAETLTCYRCAVGDRCRQCTLAPDSGKEERPGCRIKRVRIYECRSL
ncbi:transposase [Caballeronia sp. LZ001]|uniref:transposase n=1 Tax=Caballeronia sp. LZ001 TaxID=3038553 RepID=UPI0038D37932